MGGVAVKQKFRMPLEPDKKAVGGRFDGLDDSVGSQGADNEAGRGLLDGLMVRAVHPKRSLFDDAIEHAAWDDRNRVGQPRGRFRLAMGQ